MRYDDSVPLLVRLLSLALCVGGAFGVITSFLLMKSVWTWAMPDLAYRFLAGAAAAYAVGGLLTLIRRGWPESELLLASVIFYGVPLGLAIVIEPGPIDWSRWNAWLFVALVVPALVISCGAIWSNRGVTATIPAMALTSPLRWTLALIAMVSGAVGLLVFAVPRESGFVWPWAELAVWKPLDSRLLASMLLTIAGCAALTAFRNRRDMAGIFLPMLWSYCVVASGGLLIHARNTPAMRTEDLVYVAIFGVVAVGTALLFVASKPAKQPAA